jgi:hypothetical protein
MTKETSIPDSLKAQITSAPAKTTVFSDGSTFDYENGYQSNGAVVATRDRTEKLTIAKSHTIFTNGLGYKFVGWVLILGAIAFALWIGIFNMQRTENINVLKEGVNASGQAKVVQFHEGDLILKDSRGATFRCDVSMISNAGDPVGHVFCAEGQSATFSIPLRRDPNNIFYSAPLDEIEEFTKKS